ncbi:MAG: helix-turn-helix domain-containing protein [Bacteroidota bacterium]
MSTQQLNELAALAANYVNTTDRHVFLTGKAGTGKTTFLKYIVQHTFKNAVVAAPTGIAAINAGGVTLHSLLQLPFGGFIPENIQVNQSSSTQINTPATLGGIHRMRKEKKQLIRQMELLIIDEVSMLRADLLDCMDVILRALRGRNTEPFGGVQILFIGDLMQLPPVIKDSEWSVLRNYYKGPYFFHARALVNNPPLSVELQKIYRQSDQDFIDLLNRLRHNAQTNDDLAFLNQYYQEGVDEKENPGYIHLTTHNRKADKINQHRLDQLTGKMQIYEATIEGDFPEKTYPTSFGLALKEGAQVMFIKNDPSGEGKFFNGKIATVTNVDEDELFVEFEDGKEALVDTYTWENKKYELNPQTNEIEEHVLGTFEQYPLKLAWAVTIHKSQGLTFEKAILDMTDTFAAGQLYVALSRLTSLNGLILSSLLPTRPPSIDQTLQAFIAGFEDQENLKLHLGRDRKGFLWKFAQRAFGFEYLMERLTKHKTTFNKDESKSLKQKFLPWTEKLIEETLPLEETGGKFIRQVAKILQTEDDLGTLTERVKKAQGYFEPKLMGSVEKIQTHNKELAREKKVKAYREELEELNEAFVNQARQIMKFALLVEETSKGNVPDKEMMRKWEAKYQKQKELKTEKTPTALVTLHMFQEGRSIREIALMRELTEGTIQGHISYYIGKGEVDILDVMPQKKLNKILAVASKGDFSLKAVKEKLGSKFEYGEIRMALAYAKTLE